MATIPTYVINTKDVFSSGLIFADPELYECRDDKLKDKFHEESIPLKEVTFRTPTKEKELYNIFNAPHNRFVLHSFLLTNLESLSLFTNKCNQTVIRLKQTGSPALTSLSGGYKIYLVLPSTKHACLKLLMIHHLQHHVHARLGKTDYGVGVLAIRDIPKGMPIFDNLLTKCATYSPVSISNTNVKKVNSRIHKPNEKETPIESLLADFFLQTGQKINYPIPLYGPNSIDTSFYLNHSYCPNLTITYPSDCDMSVYVAAKDISAGEQLTIDYTTFGFTDDEIKARMPFLIQNASLSKKRCYNNIK